MTQETLAAAIDRKIAEAGRAAGSRASQTDAAAMVLHRELVARGYCADSGMSLAQTIDGFRQLMADGRRDWVRAALAQAERSAHVADDADIALPKSLEDDLLRITLDQCLQRADANLKASARRKREIKL